MAKKSPTARWIKKVKTVPAHLPLLPPLINEQILEEVQTALLFDEQITATYQGVSEKVLELRLHPLGLVTRGSVVYLVATANDYSDNYSTSKQCHQLNLERISIGEPVKRSKPTIPRPR